MPLKHTHTVTSMKLNVVPFPSGVHALLVVGNYKYILYYARAHARAHSTALLEDSGSRSTGKPKLVFPPGGMEEEEAAPEPRGGVRSRNSGRARGGSLGGRCGGDATKDSAGGSFGRRGGEATWALRGSVGA